MTYVNEIEEAQANPQLVTDAAGKPVDIHAFIAARNAEITAAIQQTLQAPSSPGMTR